jgi:hypothetical protein
MLLIEQVLCYFGVSGASSGFDGMSLSSFCVKGWFFFCCFPGDGGSGSGLLAVGFDDDRSCFPSNPISASARCLFNVQGASVMGAGSCSFIKV